MESRYFFTQPDVKTGQGLITSLWSNGLDGLVDDVAEAKYRDYYVENPAGCGICLVLHDAKTSKAIGVQGLIPRTFFAGNRQINAATLGDFVVLPGYRSLGPALKLMRTCIAVSKVRFTLVYGTPNDKARAIIERAGLRVLGTLTRYTKVIRSTSYWKDRLPRWIVPPVAFAVDTLIACADISRGWMHGMDWRWSEHANFGPELEKIWQGRDIDVITGERRPPVLGWRYSSFDPGSPWQISLATDSSGVPLGYVVWRRRNGIAMVSDFFCVNANHSTRALLQSFVRYIRQFPVDRLSLEFFGLSSVVEALAACGFVARDRSPIVVIAHTDEESHAASLLSNGIYMTSFDRDHES